jgi:hypothetical protein
MFRVIDIYKKYHILLSFEKIDFCKRQAKYLFFVRDVVDFLDVITMHIL